MRARQRERRIVVIKGCTQPVHRRVARRARRRIPSRNVVRIRRPLIVLRVTRVAIRRRTRKYVIDVASTAGHRSVEPS